MKAVKLMGSVLETTPFHYRLISKVWASAEKVCCSISTLEPHIYKHRRIHFTLLLQPDRHVSKAERKPGFKAQGKSPHRQLSWEKQKISSKEPVLRSQSLGQKMGGLLESRFLGRCNCNWKSFKQCRLCIQQRCSEMKSCRFHGRNCCGPCRAASDQGERRTSDMDGGEYISILQLHFGQTEIIVGNDYRICCLLMLHILPQTGVAKGVCSYLRMGGWLTAFRINPTFPWMELWYTEQREAWQVKPNRKHAIKIFTRGKNKNRCKYSKLVIFTDGL